MLHWSTGKLPFNMELDGFFVKESLEWDELEALVKLVEQIS